MTQRIAQQATIAERKKRWLRFYDPAQPPVRLFLVRCEAELGPRPWPFPDAIPARIDWAWRKYQLQLEQLAWLDDDSLPFLDVYTGTEIFAAAFGCPVHYPEDNMPFALPLVRSAEDAARLVVPTLDSPAIAPLFAIAEELRGRAGDAALVRLVDIQSPMDIAALIWDKNDLYAAFIEAPEAVHELAAKVGTLLTAFFDEWFRRYGTEHIAHYPNYYMPDGVTLSEDEVGVVNEEMFTAFFLPELEQLSVRYGGLGMHCCANSRHQWTNFKRIPNLRLLNLVQPADVLRAAYLFFADHCLQFHGGFDGPPAGWPAQVPSGARVVFETWAATPDDARTLSDTFWTACGRT